MNKSYKWKIKNGKNYTWRRKSSISVKIFIALLFSVFFLCFISMSQDVFFANKKFNKDDLVYVFMLTKPNI